MITLKHTDKIKQNDYNFNENSNKGIINHATSINSKSDKFNHINDIKNNGHKKANSKTRLNKNYNNQATLDKFPEPKIIFKHSYREFEILTQQYDEKYGTKNYDVEDPYDYTWKAKGKLRIKNMPGNSFAALYKQYLKVKKYR